MEKERTDHQQRQVCFSHVLSGFSKFMCPPWENFGKQNLHTKKVRIVCEMFENENLFSEFLSYHHVLCTLYFILLLSIIIYHCLYSSLTLYYLYLTFYLYVISVCCLSQWRLSQSSLIRSTCVQNIVLCKKKDVSKRKKKKVRSKN